MRFPTRSPLFGLFLSLLLFTTAAPADEEKLKPSEGKLRLARLDILDRSGGYAIPQDSVFYPGETVYVGFNLAGYTVSDEYRIHLVWKMEAVGPQGAPLKAAEGGEFAVEISPQDENWEPYVEYSAQLPPYAGSGVYELRLEIEDKLAEEQLTRVIPIRVEGKELSSDGGFGIRNFHFSIAPGGAALDPPVFRQGDDVWASFYITGYQLGEENSYHVESSLKVINQEGRTMFTYAPRGEEGSPFYPRLWVPAEFQLQLEETLPRGDYTVLLQVHDRLGDLTYQTEEKFFVR